MTQQELFDIGKKYGLSEEQTLKKFDEMLEFLERCVNKCYAADCLIQDSCKSFKTERCNKECKRYT